ncbi:unnamed protein product [Ilex paraguariensis]|uniref:Uncharacterized protein n=1 Tax=Ilex paraguariensis TaxID=185542 RepID=A0ABC8RYD0_9AQUA
MGTLKDEQLPFIQSYFQKVKKLPSLLLRGVCLMLMLTFPPNVIAKFALRCNALAVCKPIQKYAENYTKTKISSLESACYLFWFLEEG